VRKAMISAQVRIPVPLWLALLSLLGGCAWPAAGLRPLPLLMRGGRLTREVDVRQPTLRWEASPRPEDLKADKEGRLANARSVTYELRIWRAENDFPAEPVYVRTRRTEPIHTVEKELAPNTLYFWTIRGPLLLQWRAAGDPVGCADTRAVARHRGRPSGPDPTSGLLPPQDTDTGAGPPPLPTADYTPLMCTS